KELHFQGAQGKADQRSKFFHDEKPLLSVVWRLTLSEVRLLVPFLTSPSCPRAMDRPVIHPRLAYPWEPSVPLNCPRSIVTHPTAARECGESAHRFGLMVSDGRRGLRPAVSAAPRRGCATGGP